MARPSTGPVPPDEVEQAAQAHAAAYAAGLGGTAAAAFWVDQTAAALEALQQRTQDAIAALWLAFDDWYDGKRVIQTAQQALDLSDTARHAASSATTEYLAQVVAAMQDTRIELPTVRQQVYRNGANPWQVNARPAEVYRNTFATSGDDELARRRAVKRATFLAESDIIFAARQAEQDALEEFEIEHYRRVLRPELSKTGSCGLCVVASDRIYNTKDLLPLHGGCNCLVLPISGYGDPGQDINREDLNRIYAAAGDSTSAAELKRTRVVVREHGELGPILVRRGDTFSDADDVALRNNLTRAGRELRDIQQQLRTLERRAARGEQLGEAIAYSRSRIDLLTRLTAA